MNSWMIFKIAHNNVHYLWNGLYPIKIFQTPEDGLESDFYWVSSTEQMDTRDVEVLNEALHNNRRKQFKVHTKKFTFLVLNRGSFQMT
jgi:heme-binding NEAT domain protein